MAPRTVTLGGGGTGYAVAPSPAPAGQGRRITGRRPLMQGDVFYLWVLLGIEFTLTLALRHWSRNHHGG